jgi:hypothetical protein
MAIRQAGAGLSRAEGAARRAFFGFESYGIRQRARIVRRFPFRIKSLHKGVGMALWPTIFLTHAETL